MLMIINHGCNGKMGRVISRLVSEKSDYKIVAGIDKNSASSDFPIYTSLKDVKEDADVIIDFSFHSAVPDLLKNAELKKIPVVVATTGLSDDELCALKEASKTIPIFRSANMSLGINILINLVKEAAKILQNNYDIEIIEKHHNMKKDAPSGTALMIADAINEVLTEKKEYIYGRHSKTDTRKENELGIHAIRGGTIVGEHDVIFAGHDEILTISHSARSREIFAIGALKAAEFIVNQKPGIYDMNSLLEKG
ncbi:MAG: 4-hydroxy-tetrahydrodipicolinate reductase [Thermoanaerobacteraceae bacterium]|nr:4-hydroxy-tetrahydrodipicolinate reductase [Thermoanaerobacteraceae bacterium]